MKSNSILQAGDVLRIPPAISPDRDAEIQRKDAEREETNRLNSVYGYTRELMASRGLRYRDCTLDNFETPTPQHEAAMQKLTDYCRDIAANVNEGRGVFLFGPCGTGKDHLAMGVCKRLIKETAKQALWTSGVMLFEKLRGTFDGQGSEGSVVSRYSSAPILWISDPLPVKGELTQYQAESLYRILDERYNAKRLVVVTANIAPGEADHVLGPAIARRLRESTLQVHCHWEGFGRK